MKILDIEVPDSMTCHTLHKINWEIDDRELNPQWVGKRSSQISLAIVKILETRDATELQESAQVFVENIEELICKWGQSKAVGSRSLKLDLLGQLRTLHFIRCILAGKGVDQPELWDRLSKERVIPPERQTDFDFTLRMALEGNDLSFEIRQRLMGAFQWLTGKPYLTT